MTEEPVVVPIDQPRREPRVVVIVVSTRAAAGTFVDRTGPMIADWVVQRGWRLDGPHVVADGPPLETALPDALAGHPALILTTGGTGLSADDSTPEATAAVLDRQIPGLMEELRRRGAEHVPTALLTRGLAGVAGHSVIVNLPGSPGGVRDGLAVLDGVLEHLLDQVAGRRTH